MPKPDDQRDAEQLSSSAPIPRAPLLGAGVVLAAVAITAAVLAQPKEHHAAAPRPAPTTAPTALPLPSAASPAPITDRVSVFIEHLPGCTSTDHRGAFSVAMRVTNLSGELLRLIQVRPETAGDPGVVGTGVRIGGGACAERGTVTHVALPPAHDVVVRLGFGLDAPTCPRNAVVSGTVFFRLAGQLLHADSSTLANVQQFHFPQCA